jgi:hypothetical protein
VLLIGILFGAVHLDSVQTFLARRLTAYLSSELNTTVNVEKVSIKFIKSVVLKGFYVQDLHGDTLLYSDELNVSINDISTKDHKLEIGKLTLLNGDFNLKQYKGEKHDNLNFISEYFSSDDTSTASAPWKIKVVDVVLNNVHFTHEIKDDTAFTTGVNFSHLDVRDINGEFSDFSVVNDSIFANIKSLAFKDKSGFVLDNFSADAKVSSTEIRLNGLKIKSPNTNIQTDLTFKFDSFPSFDEFTSQVQWQSAFKYSVVSFKDIAFFAPEFYGLEKSLVLDGFFKGSVNNFKGKNVTLAWGESSWFKGNISMNGLPVIEDTYIDINAEQIKTNKKDIEWLPVPPFTEKHNITVPANLAALGNVIFKGKFTGFYSDFVAYGNIRTALGSISSDLNLKYNKKTNTSVYSGHLSANQFDMGKITATKDLGKVTFSVDIKGSGLRLDNINAKLEGKINKLEFKNYAYQNIAIDGQIAKKLFNGALSVNEPNVNFDFRGSVDYRGNLPAFNFVAEVHNAQLDTLNLYKTKIKTNLKTTIRTQFSGNDLDNIVGNIAIENTDFQTGTKLFHINSISLRAEKISRVRTFEILSDNLDAHFNGQFELAKLGDAIKEILPRYLPSVILPKKSFYSNQNFTYDIRIKNVNVFTETFLPFWDFAPNTTITGHFNSVHNDLILDMSTQWIKFKSFSLEDFDIHVLSDQHKMNIDAKAMKITNNGKNFIIQPELDATARGNEVNYTLKLADIDTMPNRAHLEGSMDFFSASNFNLKIDSSYLVIENERWLLDTSNLILFDSSSINLSALNFFNNNEMVQLNGAIGKKKTDKLELHLEGFSLDHVNSFLASDETVFGGVISGDVFLTDVYNQFQLESDIKITNLSVNNDTLGNASIISRYNSDQSIVVSNIGIIKGIAKIIDINGNYYVKRENNNLEYNIKLSNLYMHPLERYIDDVMREVYGKVSADLKLTGSLSKPVFNGTVDLNKTSLIVDYLNTRYSFTTTVQVKENEFLIDGMKLYDVNNNTATLSGKISHTYFKNFRFDVDLYANKFQVLKTTINNNSLYYGTANATGYAHFNGPIENMAMDISLSPDRGTILNIPLNTSSDLSSSNFITFIDRTKDTAQKITRSQVDLSGIKLNMNLDMNRNATINIIFDEKIGDVISGTGTGSLRLDINSAGNFNMYGTYTIERGDYLFTLQNLINKKFTIENGSRITWAGDPLEATVELSATYVVYTSSLYKIIPDSSYKRRVPVDCKLILTNKLLNPTINYDIQVRGLGPAEENLLRTRLAQDINNQMIGLLLFNQFIPPSSSTTERLDIGSGASASASELLSNQLSNWLGQISKSVNIGFNYRARDTYTNEEIQVMFSKSLFNERLILEGNVGYLGDQSYVNSNFVGDFNVEYKLSEDGRFRVKGFNRSNSDNIINYSQAPYTQGLGFFYRKEFNGLKDLFVKQRKKDREEGGSNSKEETKK